MQKPSELRTKCRGAQCAPVNLTDIFLSNYYIDENGVHYTLEIPNIVTKEESEALVYAFVTYIQNGKEKEDER